MEYLSNGFTLDIPVGVFPLSTDSMILSDFVKLPKDARVLDLAAGCGTIGTLLCAKDPRCHVIGVEIDPIAHESALANIRRNDLGSRMESICADLRFLPPALQNGTFHCCVSNPPYYSGGPASHSTPLARRDDCCTVLDLCVAANRSLRFGGDFILVHKPEKLAEICTCASGQKLEPKRLCLVRHKADAPISMILLSCRKGGKPGLQIEERCLFLPDGKPTEYYKKIYHI